MRLIDADAFECISWKGIPEGYDDTFDSGVLYVADLIDDQPTVSPDEVRGVGEWIDNGVRAWSCSCCGTPLNHIRQFAVFIESELPKYCPSCGARMKGVSEDAWLQRNKRNFARSFR